MKKLLSTLSRVGSVGGLMFMVAALFLAFDTQFSDVLGARYQLLFQGTFKGRTPSSTTSVAAIRNQATLDGTSNNALKANLLTLENKDGTTYSQLDSTGAWYANAAVARIDSFPTTVATDTLSWPGAVVGDVFLVTPRLPTWSATPDTGSSPYAAQVSSAGVVVVLRTPLSGVSTLKSAANYYIVRYKKTAS